tara:strand:- start:610 stop:1041 length:432 start_codon:yes stop_codon:yes gene_type:complete
MNHIIYIDGCFDLFHPGYISFFKKALAQGYGNSSILVGLMTDNQMTDYRCPPIMNMKERKIMLDACKYVDEIIDQPPMPITKEFIEKHNIDLVVHGNDIPDDKLNYWYGEAIKLNKFKVIPYTQDVTTVSIIERIVERSFSRI